MFCFKKNKVKMSLIDDYVKLKIAKNFIHSDFSGTILKQEDAELIKHTKPLIDAMIAIFEQMFCVLNMNDLSLLILKKELKDSNNLFLKLKQKNFESLSISLTFLSSQINNIVENLPNKQKILRLKISQLKTNESCG